MCQLLFHNRIMAFFVVSTLFFVGSIGAFYSPGRGPGDDDSREIPSRIVVKLSADKHLSPVRGGREIAVTGIESFDTVTRRYAAKSQRLLFPPEASRRHPASLKNVLVIDLPDGVDIERVLDEYRALKDVEYAHPDYKVELYAEPNDSLYKHQWYLNNIGQAHYEIDMIDGDNNDTLMLYSGTPDADIDFQEVFENPPDNTTSVVVGLVDTGADMDHPDLADNIYVNPGEIPGNGIDDDHNGYVDDVNGWDLAGDMPFFVPDNDPTDEMGHGTHCSGIIGAVTNNDRGISGVSGDVRIMPVCTYFNPYVSIFAEAVVYAADMGVDVISMSWGVGFYVEAIADAIAYASSRGIILCASAGNDGNDHVNYPAGLPETMAVSAMNSDDQLAFFSSYGSHLSVGAPGYMILSLRADDIDPFATTEPNVHIIDSMYLIASGTSMACPVVAGVAAYLRAVSPGLTHAKAKEIIEQTADDIVDPFGTGESYPGFDDYTGWGRVNLANALAAVPQARAYIADPIEYEILSGTIDLVGIADGADFVEYVLEYGDGMVPGSWTEIITSTSSVTDGVLASWNTSPLSGLYTVRLRVGEFNESRVTVYLANERIARINNPTAEDTVMDRAYIIGKAICPDFSHWMLEYGAGSSPMEWDTIVVSGIPCPGGDMTTWRCGDVPEGWYTLRLSVYSTTGLEEQSTLAIVVKSLFSGDRGWSVHLDTTLGVHPTYGDFDDDGLNEIVVGAASGLYFFNPDGTPKTVGVPSLPANDFRGPVAVGELDDDGVEDFVIVGKDPAILYGFPSTAPAFETPVPDYPVFGHFLFLKDINGDGRDEIHYSTGHLADSVPVYIFNPDGSPWECATPIAYSRDAYIPADMDGDGICEIYSCDGDTIRQLDTCGEMVGYYVPEGSGYFVVEGLSAVDIDGDHLPEIIASGWFQVNMWTFTSNQLIYAFDEGLTIMPGWPHDTELDVAMQSIPHPIFADLDNDAELECIGPSGGAYVWNLDGTIFAPEIAPEGRLAIPPDQTGTGGSLLLVDINGDGYVEIASAIRPGSSLYSEYDGEGVVAWNRMGEFLPGWPIDVAFDLTGYLPGSGTPVIGDVDDDGVVDLFMATLTNDLVFTEFPGMPYMAGRFTCPYWRYNRSMDYTYIPTQATDCGDASGDGAINVADAVYLINYIFKGGAAPVPECIGDADGSGGISIADAVYLIDYVFRGGPPPLVNCCP